MAAPCKHLSSKPGKGTQPTLALLKRHSITVRGATAKRGTANTQKRWKRRRPRNAWRINYAPLFVRRDSPGDSVGDTGSVGATGYAERFPGEIRRKRQCASGEGVRRAGWADWFMVGLGTHVLRRCEEPLDRRAARRLLLREAA